MSEVSPLSQEVRAFTRYLSGSDPDDYVRSAYVRALTRLPELDESRASWFDRLLLTVGRRGGVLLRPLDGYARLFRPASPLRKRLVLLLAILESWGPSSERLERFEPGSPAVTLARLAASVAVSIVGVAVAFVILGPLDAASRLLSSAAPRAA